MTARRIVLASRPMGMPRSENFRIEEDRPPEPRPSEFLIDNHILSIDPAIRGFLDDRPSYLPPVAIGETIRGMTLGRVVKSRRPDIAEGSYVRALGGWADRLVLGDALGLETVHPAPGIRLESYMGALGPAGLTAWVGLKEIGRISAGDTVLISAAAGAVGSVAGQIARLSGCRVAGLAGSPEKARRLIELGYDVAIDYRAELDLDAALRSACPDGIDVYFDNVGAATLERMLPLMREHGRVVICGMIDQYNDADHPYGVKTLWQLVVKRITMRGFLTYDHADRLAEAAAELDDWVRTGALLPTENVYHGLERAPEAFIDLMSGRTMGKTLVRTRD
jgi:NADPH-dependent curcumin reductase CurA